MGVELMVVDQSNNVSWRANATNWLHAASNVNELYMWDINSMVDNIGRRLDSLAGASVAVSSSPTGVAVRRPGPAPKMSFLTISDHGSALSVEFGTDCICATNLPQFESKLGELTPRFEAGAMVHLLHCYAGLHEEMLRRLAQLWGVILIGSVHETHWITNGADLNPFNRRGAIYADRHGTVLRDGATSYTAQRRNAELYRFAQRLRP